MWTKRFKKSHYLTSGLLLRDLPNFSKFSEHDTFSTYDFSIIITQACDIESYYDALSKKTESDDGILHFESGQIITQLIFCPAFDEDVFKAGEHLFKQFNYMLPVQTSKQLKKIQKKNTERFHFIQSEEDSLPNIIIDFKHYFTLPISEVELLIDSYDFVFQLSGLHFAELADRFAHHLQRVAIP